MTELNVELLPCLQDDGVTVYVAVIPRYTTSRAGLVEAWALVLRDRDDGEYIPVPVFTEWF